MGSLSGLLIGGPVGMAVGAVVGASMTELVRLQLGPVGQKRHQEFWRLVLERMTDRNKNGEMVNKDLFEVKKDGSFAIKGVCEGAVMGAIEDNEDKKRKYYANFMANIAFDRPLDIPRATLMINIALRLSYRQLCLLRVFSRIKVTNINNLRDTDYRGGRQAGEGGSIQLDDLVLVALLQEITDLYKDNLLQIPNNTILGLTDINPAKIILLPTARELVRLMNLEEIPDEDLESVVELLSSHRLSNASG